MSNNDAISVDKVCKAFRTRHFMQLDEDTRKRVFYKENHVSAAKSISFDIPRGQIFGLLGPNGAGKTTTVKMISGLVKPDSGVVRIDGLNVETKRRQILQKVGVVLEGTRTSIWPLTPLENLEYYGNLKDITGQTLKDRSHDLLDFIGLKEKKNVEVRKLSRGQKQKLAICIALIADPDVILLDEPTTGLDVQSSRAIKDNIIAMTRERNKCVLVTTHDMHVAQELCDRIGIINNGELVTCKPTEELLDLFSEQIFVFKLDRVAEPGLLDGVPGVEKTEYEQGDEGPQLAVHVNPELAERSAAIYGVTRKLEAGGYLLRGVQQRQQNLEGVFLKLTKKE